MSGKDRMKFPVTRGEKNRLLPEKKSFQAIVLKPQKAIPVHRIAFHSEFFFY